MKIQRFILLSILFWVRASQAQSPSASPPSTLKRYVTLDHSVDLSFTPEDILYFVDFGDSVGERIRGSLLQSRAEKSSLKEGLRHWSSAARIPVPEGKDTVYYGVLYIGRDRKFYLEPRNGREVKNSESTDALREKLLQKKELLKSWEIQVKTQEETLQRLRDDANVIGNLGRILEVKDELEHTHEVTSMLDRDIDNLKEFLRLARARVMPKNYAGREEQLTRQIADLAQAAKGAESQEFSRKSKAQGELQRKLGLIEQTRNDSFDDLQRALVKLKAQRESLERDAKTKFAD